MKGRFAGLDVDIVREFTRRTGLRCEFVQYDELWDLHAMPGLWEQKIDMAIGGIGFTPHRNAETVEWSMPYFHLQRSALFNKVTRPDLSKGQFPQDIRGIMRGASGSTGSKDAWFRIQAARKRGDLHPDFDVRKNMETFDSANDKHDIADLISGKVEVVMRGAPVARALMRKNTKMLGMMAPWDALPEIVGPYGENFAFPCRRGSGLAGQLNTYLLHILQSGKMMELRKRHGVEE